MKPLIGCIIQARLGSTRLPRKHLLQIAGKPLLEHLVNRVHSSKLIDKVVLACPENPECCLNEEIFIGSENDVLDRYYQVAKKYNFDVIVRITADCPLIPVYEIDRCIQAYLEYHTHYLTNIQTSGRFGLPDGWDCEVFSFQALEIAWENSEEREHVTTYMKSNLGFHPVFLDPIKLSVDTLEDYERVKEFYLSECSQYQLPTTEGSYAQ
jgi:spore coat polysaccharide biosynthesis protein SpsF (cytidylyltransferase family)